MNYCNVLPPNKSRGANYYQCGADNPVKQRECGYFRGSDLATYCSDNRDDDQCKSLAARRKGVICNEYFTDNEEVKRDFNGLG